MPRLLGHFPLTITMCLRALAMHHIVAPGGGGGRSAVLGKGGRGGKGASAQQGAAAAASLAVDTLATLFEQPFYAAKDPGLLQQARHRGAERAC